jgi:hypothetical protein
LLNLSIRGDTGGEKPTCGHVSHDVPGHDYHDGGAISANVLVINSLLSVRKDFPVPRPGGLNTVFFPALVGEQLSFL